MKTLIKQAFLGVFILSCAQFVNAQITLPRSASPAAEVSQTIGLSKVTVNYSKPSVNGRAIWGALVPYGYTKFGFGPATAAPWRAGANENTTITLSHKAKIEGTVVPAGTYGLFFGVHENGDADFILSKNTSSWGSFFYDEAEDQMRVKIKTKTIPLREQLTYDFVDNSNNSTILVLDWEKKRFPVKIEFDVHEIVLSNAREELRGTTGFSWQGANSAANYCLQNNINQEEGLKWAEASIANNKNFNNLFVKARLLESLGKGNQTAAIYDEAKSLANVNQLNAMGYQMMGSNQDQKALELFKLNVKKNPSNANCHDSLGECYRKLGETKLAIKSFRKSLSLEPPANVKANSIKNLNEMGVDTTGLN